MNLFKKEQDTNKPTEIALPEDQWIKYNGQNVHWFIGDFNSSGNYWGAWGSCNNHAYQMFGKFNRKSRKLTGIKVIDDQNGYYFHQPTYDLLTK